LVEILVVLAILAGLMAIAFPQFVTLYARVRTAFDRDDLEQQLYALPQRVRESGRAGILAGPVSETDPPEPIGDASFELEEPQLLHLDLPAGWQIQIPKPILYHFSGACDGGEVTFSLPPVSLHYRLSPPLCLPRLADVR
jgi:type II secretory pathway pseudopilin PulG